MSEPTTSIELLEALKRHFADENGVPASDYRVGKILGMTKGGISTWRRGKSLIGDDAALKVAEILGLDVQFVLASLAAERAARTQNVRVSEAWSTIARRVAAVGIIGVTASLPFSGAPGGAVAAEADPSSACYVKSRRNRRSGRRDGRSSPLRLRPSPGRVNLAVAA